MFEIFVLLLIVYLLATRLYELKLLVEICRKLDKNVEKEEKPKRVHAKVAKTAYASPLKTFKEYDKYKDKKSGLYAPVEPSRGLKIEGEDK